MQTQKQNSMSNEVQKQFQEQIKQQKNLIEEKRK